MSKPIINNPCKYCLKKPVCYKMCHDFIKYQSINDTIWFISTCIGLLFISTYILFSCRNNDPIFYTIITTLAISYTFTIKLLHEGNKPYNDDKLDILLCMFLAPFGFMTCIIFEHLKIDKLIQNAQFKHNKKLKI